MLDAPLAFSILSRYHAFKILLLKSDTETRANVSSFFGVRLNNNTESYITKFQSRCSEPSSKILCMSKFRLGKQLAGLAVIVATPTKKHLEEKIEMLRPDSRLARP